jgi:hypothetical protein
MSKINAILEHYISMRPHNLDVEPVGELIDLNEDSGTNIKHSPTKTPIKITRDEYDSPSKNFDNNQRDEYDSPRENNVKNAGTNMIVPGRTLTTNNITTNNVTTQQHTIRPRSELGEMKSSPSASWQETKPSENIHLELPPQILGMKFDLFYNPGGNNRNRRSNYRLSLSIRNQQSQVQVRANLNSPLNKLVRYVNEPDNDHWLQVVKLANELKQLVPDLRASKLLLDKKQGSLQNMAVFVFKQEFWTVIFVLDGLSYVYELVDEPSDRFILANGIATLTVGSMINQTERKGLTLWDIL